MPRLLSSRLLRFRSPTPATYAFRNSGPRLTAANGRRIACWGHRRGSVVLDGQPFKWRFLRAAVKFPILGADFLSHFNLLVDVAHCRLISRPDNTTASTSEPAAGGPTVAAAVAARPSLPTSSLEEPWQSLLQQFGDVSPPADQLPHPKHGVEHRITTAGQPVSAKFRRLDPERLAAARAEFDAMLAAGIVRRSNSGWSSPLHMVRKKDGGWRPCGDFRRLNLITEPDRYPLPKMGELSARLEGCRICRFL
jgi:hypothetical protein